MRDKAASAVGDALHTSVRHAVSDGVAPRLISIAEVTTERVPRPPRRPSPFDGVESPRRDAANDGAYGLLATPVVRPRPSVVRVTVCTRERRVACVAADMADAVYAFSDA